MAQRNEPTQTGHDQAPQPAGVDARITEEELLADLRRVARDTTAPLSEREYAENGQFGVTTFRRRFGSWNAAKQQAGLQTRTPDRIDDEQLLEDLRRVSRATDESVTERTYADRGRFGVTTFRRRFGSWNAAKRLAGLETERTAETAEAVGDDIARVADDVTYVTPEVYAERGSYPLSMIPTDDTFWTELREQVGLAVTPLYHKVAGDSADADG